VIPTGAIRWSTAITSYNSRQHKPPIQVLLIELLSDNIQTVNEGPAGEIIHGHLHIRAGLLQAEVAMKGRFPDERHQYDMEFTIEFGAAARELRVRMGSIEYKGVAYFDDHDERKKLETQDIATLTIMPMVRIRESRVDMVGTTAAWREEYLNVEGLIIRKTENKVQGFFNHERVGYFAGRSKLDLETGEDFFFS